MWPTADRPFYGFGLRRNCVQLLRDISGDLKGAEADVRADRCDDCRSASTFSHQPRDRCRDDARDHSTPASMDCGDNPGVAAADQHWYAVGCAHSDGGVDTSAHQGVCFGAPDLRRGGRVVDIDNLPSVDLGNGYQPLERDTEVTCNEGQVVRDAVWLVANRVGAVEAFVVPLGDSTSPAEKTVLETCSK